ncbi:MAG: CopG family transcriptional regulator [Chloroflexi bacterium]|nr:CopG family transcriptional regulator [Chloroflexota bacterium]
MMGAISLKLSDDLVQASSECARALHLSRAEYIRRAIERMNRETRAQLRSQRLAEVSRRVRDESMRVNAEFAAVEQDPDAE